MNGRDGLELAILAEPHSSLRSLPVSPFYLTGTDSRRYYSCFYLKSRRAANYTYPLLILSGNWMEVWGIALEREKTRYTISIAGGSQKNQSHIIY